MRYKYPKTMHLPWSPGTTSEDRILPSVSHFNGCEVVVTEKLDGENSNLYCDYFHPRSLAPGNHVSQSVVKSIHGSIKTQIPKGWRICGENVYALHSIFYDNLPSFFFVFSVWDENNHCLSWDDTVSFCQKLNLLTVPVLYRGQWDEDKIKECWSGVSLFAKGNEEQIELPRHGHKLPNEQEGYVVRKTCGFAYDDFGLNVAKFVRKNHVKTDELWKKNWIPNSASV